MLFSPKKDEDEELYELYDVTEDVTDDRAENIHDDDDYKSNHNENECIFYKPLATHTPGQHDIHLLPAIFL